MSLADGATPSALRDLLPPDERHLVYRYLRYLEREGDAMPTASRVAGEAVWRLTDRASALLELFPDEPVPAGRGVA